MAYLLDADVFIRAKNLHYGLDFCPAFWDWLITKNLNGKVFSVEKVEDMDSCASEPWPICLMNLICINFSAQSSLVRKMDIWLSFVVQKQFCCPTESSD